MSALPEELWRRILEIGVQRRGFSYKDLCCLSISSRRLHRLSDEDFLWSHLLSSDFPPFFSPSSSSITSTHSSSCKYLYKLRYERDRDKKIAAHRRAVLRKESQVLERFMRLRDMETRLAEETNKMRATLAELSNLSNVRQASVALNVWQPEIIRGRQKQIVEQCVVPVESRFHVLQMELKLCKQQILGLEKAHEMSEGDALEPSRLLCLVAYLEPQMRGCLGQRSTSVSNSGSTAIYSLLVIGLLLIRRRGHLDLLAVSSQKLV